MRVLILGYRDAQHNVRSDYYQHMADFFSHAVNDSSVEVTHAVFSDLRFEITDTATIYDTCNSCDLRDYDLVFLRGLFRTRLDVAFAVSRYMRFYHKQILNDYGHAYTPSKLSQAYIFAELGINVPYTVCASGTSLESYAERLQLPFICKEVYGAHGENNHLITRLEQLSSVLHARPDHLYLLQTFIPNDGDFRLLIIGNGHLIIKRVAAVGSHLNNTSQGARAELLAPDALPAEIIAQARRCAEVLGMTAAGIDIMYDADSRRYVFLEINSQPQIMTGAFVDEKQRLIGQYLTDLAAGLE